MRFLIFAICLQLAIISQLHSKCPAAIPKLPTLDVPIPNPAPVATCNTPSPTKVKGYLPFTFVNNTGLSADEIYLVVLVNSSTGYLSFSGNTHKLGKISKFKNSTYLSSSTYSYPLSSFEEIKTDTYTFYIPNDGNTSVSGSAVMKSSRILVSLKNRLTYFINNSGILEVPSEFDATNDNYFVLNDKIEFDLGSNGYNRLNLNLTGVDFFGLPLLVQANYKYLNGATYTNACGVTGMPTSVTFDDVFTKYVDSLDSLLDPYSEHWNSLVVTYTNPSSGGGDTCYLRVFAPATAMGSTQTQTNPSKVSFPTNYFLDDISTPKYCTWFNAVWAGVTKSRKTAYYQQTKPKPYLVLDATTASGAATAKGHEIGPNFHFLISGGPDKGKTVVFPQPTSSKAFFTGAVSDYKPAIRGSASMATKAQLLKVFATAIISGIIPFDCKPNSTVITNTWIQSKSSSYFSNNAILDSQLTDPKPDLSCSCEANVPWFDYYSRALLTIGSPNLFYTSAYSDFLGCDGTIVIVNLVKDNSSATITVNLNDCSTNVNFPDPYSDTTEYNLQVGIPAKTSVQFGTSKSGPWGKIPNAAKGNQFFLKVTYNSGIYKGKSFVTQIAPSARVFHPILPGQGTITTEGSNTNVVLGVSPSN